MEYGTWNSEPFLREIEFSKKIRSFDWHGLEDMPNGETYWLME